MGTTGFGMFGSVRLGDDGTTLVVVGMSTPAPGGEVRVAIHDVEDVNRRLEGQVPTPIRTSSWQAVLDQPDEAPFVEGEPVLVVGQATSKGRDLFLWANQLDIT